MFLCYIIAHCNVQESCARALQCSRKCCSQQDFGLKTLRTQHHQYRFQLNCKHTKSERSPLIFVMTELMSVANVLLRQMRALSAVIEISEHLYTHILLLVL